MFEVFFEGGTSRKSGLGCNYMIVNCDGVELYSEYLIDDDDCDMDDFDVESYLALKGDIIKQANEQGISVDSLDFPTL